MYILKYTVFLAQDKFKKYFFYFLVFSCMLLQAEESSFFELAKKTQMALSHVSYQNVSQSHFQPCHTPQCLSFQDSPHSNITFFIHIDPSKKAPSISFDSSSKTLTLPSIHFLTPSSELFPEVLFKQFLVGHSWHPYSGKRLIMRESQQTALQAFHQALEQKAQGFLLVSPTGTGKTSVLAQSLLNQIQRSQKKIFIVTAHRVQLVHQLFSHIQEEKEKLGLANIHTVNWSQSQPGGKSWQSLSGRINQVLDNQETFILVITSQSLSARLNDFQTHNQRYGVYTKLTHNLGGIYIDEAHHLGAYQTKEMLQKLIQESKAFLYGATATPYHHEVELSEFFERKHWAYLNFEENLFEVHSIEKIVEQLSISIDKGDITPFDDLYVIGKDSFFTSSEQESNVSNANKKPELLSEDIQQEKSSLFIQRSTSFYVLNSQYYESLYQILEPLFQDNLKGFIITADIEEAESIAEFLGQRKPEMMFEAYHSGISQDERREILQRSKEFQGSHYIVAVNALDEGVDLPHLSAYIDLNSSISTKERVHRIGRVLRVYPGKLGADILFLVNYENATTIEGILKVLELVERTSFKGSQQRKQEILFSEEEKGIQRLSKQDLLEIRKQLRDSVRKFWNPEKKSSLMNHILQWVVEYQRNHPDIDLNFKNFNDYRSEIHSDIPSVHVIRRWYYMEHGNTKGFVDWLLSRKKRKTFSLEEMREQVKEYQRNHPDIDLNFKNFNHHREHIHPDMLTIEGFKQRYKSQHGNTKGFADWLLSRKKRKTFSLEEMREQFKEYQRRHPDIDLNSNNFNHHREHIHPDMLTIEGFKQRYKSQHGNTTGFADWLLSRKKRKTFSLEEMREQVKEYQRRHPDIDLNVNNFNHHRKHIHPDMLSIGGLQRRYKDQHGNAQGFADWFLSGGKRNAFSLEEVREQVKEYQKNHPDIDLNVNNFNHHREHIHPDMLTIEGLQRRYKDQHGNAQGFANWLLSGEKRNAFSLEEMREQVKEYQRRHPDIDLNSKNFDHHRKHIHPDMLSIAGLIWRYKDQHGNAQGFADWFFSRKRKSLEEVREQVKEYQRRHPDIDLHSNNFNHHREHIHPDLPNIYDLKRRYKDQHGNTQGFADWLFSRKCKSVMQNSTSTL